MHSNFRRSCSKYISCNFSPGVAYYNDRFRRRWVICFVLKFIDFLYSYKPISKWQFIYFLMNIFLKKSKIDVLINIYTYFLLYMKYFPMHIKIYCILLIKDYSFKFWLILKRLPLVLFKCNNLQLTTCSGFEKY